ncbi:MAG: hypothetical protein OEM00_12240, partial [Burkholderiaceae bacterium]|nr:hypothetical protein [Burkholderiaceae bacterium]
TPLMAYTPRGHAAHNRFDSIHVKRPMETLTALPSGSAIALPPTVTFRTPKPNGSYMRTPSAGADLHPA